MSQQPYGHAPTGPPPSPAQAPATRQAGPRRLGIVAVALAAIALGFAVAAWLRAATAPDASPAYTQEQVADAKKAVCEAFDLGQRALKVTGSKTGTNPSDDFIVAVNSRVAVQSISDHLQTTVSQQPATPPNLADFATELSGIYRRLLLQLLADRTTQELSGLYGDLDASTSRVQQACQ